MSDDQLTRAERMLMAERRVRAAAGQLDPTIATTLQSKLDEQITKVKAAIEEQRQHYVDAMDGTPTKPQSPGGDGDQPNQIKVQDEDVTKLENSPPHVWRPEPTPWGTRYVLASAQQAVPPTREVVEKVSKKEELAELEWRTRKGLETEREPIPRPTYRMAASAESVQEPSNDRISRFLDKMTVEERAEFDKLHRASIAGEMQHSDDQALRLFQQLALGPRL